MVLWLVTPKRLSVNLSKDPWGSTDVKYADLYRHLSGESVYSVSLA